MKPEVPFVSPNEAKARRFTAVVLIIFGLLTIGMGMCFYIGDQKAFDSNSYRILNWDDNRPFHFSKKCGNILDSLHILDDGSIFFIADSKLCEVQYRFPISGCEYRPNDDEKFHVLILNNNGDYGSALNLVALYELTPGEGYQLSCKTRRQ